MTSKQTLYEKLIELRDSDLYPCHMPGHKRNPDVGAMAEYYQIDLTEIDGFDNLHDARGILRDIEKQAADLYGSKDAFMLVNGSTAGILAAIMSQTQRRDTVIMARGCHKSVYHALYLQELEARYLMPRKMLPVGGFGEITAAQAADCMDKNPGCKTVIITSPTYEGLLMDIEAISKEVHDRDGILIVDAAHGAHLGFCDAVPAGPIGQGADLAVVSLHKTMPAMTQTGLVLVGSDRINKERLKKCLSMVQTSSPSYVLMASIQESLLYAREHGDKALQDMVKACGALADRVNRCNYVRIAVNGEGFPARAGRDPGKLVIFTKNDLCSGSEIYRFLREEHHLQPEMAAEKYALLMMTMADRPEAYERLEKALLNLDEILTAKAEKADTCIKTDHMMEAGAAMEAIPAPETVYPLWRVMDEETWEVPLSFSIGSVAADFIGLYPPGIPILVPGEQISEAHRDLLQRYLHQGLYVQEISPQGNLRVYKE